MGGHVAGPVMKASAAATDPGRSEVEDAERDQVYEASIQSFPASDPPAWTSMRAGPPAAATARPEGFDRDLTE